MIKVHYASLTNATVVRLRLQSQLGQKGIEEAAGSFLGSPNKTANAEAARPIGHILNCLFSTQQQLSHLCSGNKLDMGKSPNSCLVKNRIPNISRRACWVQSSENSQNQQPTGDYESPTCAGMGEHVSGVRWMTPGSASIRPTKQHNASSASV